MEFRKQGECEYSTVLDLDLASISPGVAGPKRPQDRIELPNLKNRFVELLQKPASEGGYGKPKEEMDSRYFTRIGTVDIAKKAIAGGGEQTSHASSGCSGGDRNCRRTRRCGPRLKWSTTVPRRIAWRKFIRTNFRTLKLIWAMATC